MGLPLGGGASFIIAAEEVRRDPSLFTTPKKHPRMPQRGHTGITIITRTHLLVRQGVYWASCSQGVLMYCRNAELDHRPNAWIYRVRYSSLRRGRRCAYAEAVRAFRASVPHKPAPRARLREETLRRPAQIDRSSKAPDYRH